MSRNPLPITNPRIIAPEPVDKSGNPVGWGEREGAGCWVDSCMTVEQRQKFIRKVKRKFR